MAGGDAVGADERDVDPQRVQDPQHLFADGGLGESADPSAEQLQRCRGNADTRAAIGTELVTTVSS